MIRPVDMQIVVSQTSEVGKVEHNNMHKPNQDQFHFQNELSKQIDQEQKQVTESNEAEKKMIREEEKKRQNKQKQKKKEEDESKKKKENGTQVSNSTSMFDIKI